MPLFEKTRENVRINLSISAPPKAYRYAGGINRRLKPGEYQRACSRLLGKGFDHGFFQDLESASGEYVPDFDLSGLEAEE